MTVPLDRESISESANPLGVDGIEFIEYAAADPQALGGVLLGMGFQAVARHRSRAVTLYRQGGMNLVVNAQPGGLPSAVAPQPVDAPPAPLISALALRVHDAGAAYRHALEHGAWAVPIKAAVMELNIPAIHGVGTSRLYFVDRHREFSIYDVDFVWLPGVERRPPALAGLHFFGVVQYIGNERSDDWTEFYARLFGFGALPDEHRFGVMPKGRVLRSPCGSFHLQMIEPEPGILDVEGSEGLIRIGLGTPDVPAAVDALRRRGVRFVESAGVHAGARGALTQSALGGVVFELVRNGT